MIKYIAKNFPLFNALLVFGGLLVFLFFFNWFLSNLMGDNIIVYDEICVVGEYNSETYIGSLTCGDYVVTNGNTKFSNFVSIVYIEKLPIWCEISVHEYTGETRWSCHAVSQEENEDS